MSGHRLLRLTFLGVGAATLVVVAILAALWWILNASLPRLDGTLAIPGLTASVTVLRDALGVPTIRAANRLDAARALGFVHAQERFFQMDLLRRAGAGELAEILGPGLVEHDEGARRHGFRVAARSAVEQARERDRQVLQAYTDGVNAGLSALGARPPEYLLLRSRPVPWRPEDSLLVGYAMYFTLQDSQGSQDLRLAAIQRALPASAADFFFPESSDWDAALDDTTLQPPPIPDRRELDFNHATAPSVNSVAAAEWPHVAGSSSWGVQGDISATGAAIIANDMHLDLGMPNIWFRVHLVWGDEANPQALTELLGASLPGVPALIVASNRHIAWAFTNASLDTTDVVDLDLDPRDSSRYRTPEGWRQLERIEEIISVQGGPALTLQFERSIWGPVMPGGTNGSKQVLCWTPHQAGSVNLNLLDLESARTVSEALAIAPQCGVPIQNFLVGDRSGALAWSLIGRAPRRVGFDGRVPVSRSDGGRAWVGWTDPNGYPRLNAPAGGHLWTANNRIMGMSAYVTLGIQETDLGARAAQIRDDLRALPAPVRETALMAIHRDDRALFLARWQELSKRTLRQLPVGTNVARWEAARVLVDSWGARAATNSVGFRLVRAFRWRVMERVMEPVVARCQALDRNQAFLGARQEQPVWRLLAERPPHLLNPRFATYDALLADAMDAVLNDIDRRGLPLEKATWGERNTVRIRHPISRAVPALGRWLDLAPTPLPGDDFMPRVQGTSFGASERMVVSPGHEETGLFHMPGGQSGHFLSPYYRSGHASWVNVEPTALLPGPARHTLALEPPHSRAALAR